MIERKSSSGDEVCVRSRGAQTSLSRLSLSCPLIFQASKNEDENIMRKTKYMKIESIRKAESESTKDAESGTKSPVKTM
jgi:hypothetical protein